MNTILRASLLFMLLAPGAARAEISAGSAVEAAIEAGFSDLERQVIAEYYGHRYGGGDTHGDRDDRDGRDGKDKGGKDRGGKNKDLPPGLAKRDTLPPGLAKREVLPPGLAKRGLPDDLEHKLPPPPKGYQRRIVDGVDAAVIVLVHEATGIVTDIIKEVVIPHGKD